MPRPAATHPTDGELEILRILWNGGSQSLSSICEELRKERPVATTTIATMLRVMLDKKLVKRSGSGRGAEWAAAVTQEKTARSMVRKLVDGLFDGSAELLAAHLIEGGALSPRQLTELQALIRQHANGKKG